MIKKITSHISMRLYMILLVTVEFCLTILFASIVTILVQRYLKITVDIPGVVLIVLIGTALGSAITFFLSKWFFDPVKQLGKAMRQVSEGDFEVHLEEENRFHEMEEIYSNFNLMVRELKATEILQTDFVSNVSHEFKTPINAIEGYATLLQGSERALGADEQKYVEKILLNTRRLSSLVGNILLLSKADNQSIPSRQTTFRLDEQIRQSIVLLEPEWDKKEIEFDVDLDVIEYTGNEGLLAHVWNNLIGNAIKFNPTGGFVRMKLHRKEEGIVFTIEDTGPGIAKEASKHIFDRFYQGDSSHKEEGNGLGLALVKQIVQGCEGSVTAENVTEGGCRFTVVLPIKE